MKETVTSKQMKIVGCVSVCRVWARFPRGASSLVRGETSVGEGNTPGFVYVCVVFQTAVHSHSKHCRGSEG